MRRARAMITAIVLLALRHLVRRKLGAGVAVIGLAFGVAAMAATQLLYDSVVASHGATTTRLAGRAALQVTNGDSGVPEELADELRAIPGVQAVAASAEGFVATPDFPGEQLYLYGVDLLADQEVREYGAETHAVVSDPMVFLAAPDSVALTEDFARAHGVALDGRVRVLTPAGIVELTARAMLREDDGPATALDGRLAIVDLSVAQQLLGLERRVSELALVLEPRADVDALERAVAARVGARGIVQRPRSRTAGFARLLANYRNGFVLAAATAGIVGLYLLFNLAAIAIAERRREIGLLRALGMGRGAVAGLALAEIVVVASIAVVCGLPLAGGLAGALLAGFDAGVATLYGGTGHAALQASLGRLTSMTVLGVLTPFAAAGSAIAEAVRIRPIEALRPTVMASAARRHALGGPIVGAAVAVGAAALWLGRGRLALATDTAGMMAMLGALAAVVATMPAVVRLAVRVLNRLAGACRAPIAVLAARNARGEAHRFGVTCAGVLVSVAGAIAIGTWISSLDRTLDAAFSTVFSGVDLIVSAGADPFAPEAVRMPAAIATDLAQWSTVADVNAVRVNSIAFADARAAVIAGDTGLYRDGRRQLALVEGDPAEVARGLADGSAVIVNQAFARRFGRAPGDVLELMTPEGALRVRIAGIHLELMPGDLGTIRMDRALYRRWWRDDTINLAEVSLRTGADRRRVADAIRKTWGDRFRVVVFTIERLRRTYRDLLRRLGRLVYPLLALGLACALVGVASTGGRALIARRRTVAMMRAVGITRSQLAAMVGWELGGIGLLAALLAAGVGSALGWLEVEVLLRGTLGMAVLYAYPRTLAIAAGTGVTLVAALTGWLLGRVAGRTPVGAALQWE